MVERCELCGARLKADDGACRECGTPRPKATPPAADESAQPETSVEPSMSFADIATPPVVAQPVPPQPVPPQPVPAPGPLPPSSIETAPAVAEATSGPPEEFEFGEPTPSIAFENVGKSRPWLWTGLAIVLVGGVAAATLLPESDQDRPADVAISEAPPPDEVAPKPLATDLPADACELAELAGEWNFTTQVIGAKSAKKLDIQGHYTAKIDVEIAGCTAQASLAKTGFTGSKFPARAIQRASRAVVRGEGAFAFGFGGRFSLRDARAKGIDQQFFFTVRGDQLVGVWRQRGSEWDRNGLHGILVGSKTTPSAELAPRMAKLPCGARCAITCDALSRNDADATTGMAECETTCEETDEPAPACGTRQPASDELVLPLTGPQPQLRPLCRKMKCELDPKLKRGRAVSVSDNEAPIHGAHLVHSTGKGEGRKGGLRVALQTEAGWYLSAPIAKLPRKGGRKEVDGVHLVATGLGTDKAGDTVVGQFESGHRVSFFACRQDGSEPVCIVARNLPSSRDVAVVPGQTVALRGPDGSTLHAW